MPIDELKNLLNKRLAELATVRRAIAHVQADTDPNALAQALMLEVALEQVIEAIEKGLRHAGYRSACLKNNSAKGEMVRT